jgi:hypothetical protein
MADKACTKCKVTKLYSDFQVDRQKASGLSSQCKSCRNDKAKDYYKLNREKINTSNLQRYYLNHEENKKKCLSYYYNNKDVVFKNCAKRRAAKLSATPIWVDKKHEDRIKSIYSSCIKVSEKTKIPHHVDHIIPLQSKEVCGLHVWWNLRIIPAKENLSKGNRTWPNMRGEEP